MSDRASELGRRAIALANWEWLPGMLALSTHEPLYSWRAYRDTPSPNRVLWVQESGLLARHPVREEWLVPSVSDPATIGCLLGLARRLYGRGWCVPHVDGYWRYFPIAGGESVPVPPSDTEAGAVIAAIEAWESGARP